MSYSALGDMVIVKIPNPMYGKTIVTLEKSDVTYEANGIVDSMGWGAVSKLGDLVGRRVQYIGQMMRHVFGDAEVDEHLYVVVPVEALIAMENGEEELKAKPAFNLESVTKQ